MTVKNFPGLPKTMRDIAAGYYVALCELTGAQNVQVVSDDRPPVWRWVVSWS